MSKKLSQYGMELLTELEADRKSFRKGDMEVIKAKTISTMANSTSTAIRTSLACQKFETAVALAK